jgi:hypothetical protein
VVWGGVMSLAATAQQAWPSAGPAGRWCKPLCLGLCQHWLLLACYLSLHFHRCTASIVYTTPQRSLGAIKHLYEIEWEPMP